VVSTGIVEVEVDVANVVLIGIIIVDEDAFSGLDKTVSVAPSPTPSVDVDILSKLGDVVSECPSIHTSDNPILDSFSEVYSGVVKYSLPESTETVVVTSSGGGGKGKTASRILSKRKQRARVPRMIEDDGMSRLAVRCQPTNDEWSGNVVVNARISKRLRG
jgi:hypothetical protein